MPKFQFNKLVRDKLPDIYNELNQKIVSRRLVGVELLNALRNKLIEEASEIPFENGTREDIIGELSDLEQVLDDMKLAAGITDDDVKAAKHIKFAKKGGFTKGVFVESIDINDDDEWVAYYRREPEKYEELT